MFLRSHPPTPGRYPRCFTNSLWRIFFLCGVWGSLRYLQRVCGQNLWVFQQMIRSIIFGWIIGPTWTFTSNFASLGQDFLASQNGKFVWIYFFKVYIPSRELTYSTWEKGKLSSNILWVGIYEFPGGYIKVCVFLWQKTCTYTPVDWDSNGKWTRIESMYFLLNMVIFQPSLCQFTRG